MPNPGDEWVTGEVPTEPPPIPDAWKASTFLAIAAFLDSLSFGDATQAGTADDMTKWAAFLRMLADEYDKETP